VTTLADTVDAFDGLTSLREAIAFAGSDADAGTITFASGLSGAIHLGSAGQLAIAGGPLTIDGDGPSRSTPTPTATRTPRAPPTAPRPSSVHAVRSKSRTMSPSLSTASPSPAGGRQARAMVVALFARRGR
jgi:hypothetical protein